MAKIAEVIKLRSGYANFVELKSAFEEAQENAERMAMYRPTKAHRQAFERIGRGVYQPTDKKFYLLSGSYGTGKSHLCLMTANFLSRSSGDPQISGFYENYARLDADKAQMLKNIRKDGQYLVAICDYHAGGKFEDVVLRGVFEACAGRGLDAGVQTEFDEAERQLADWEEKGGKGIRNFYDDFRKALEELAPGMSVVHLRAGLKGFDSEALARFRTAFKLMMGGVEFHARSGNLIPILTRLIKSQPFKDRFKGLAIFFDEFGFTLEKGAYSKDVLQGFMETICKNEPNVIFIGCIHKDFKAYADRFSKDDAAVMSARITQVDLLNEGIEEIIGAIVETDKQCDIWRNEVAPKTGIFDALVPPCKALDLFPWIEDVDRIRQRVLEDIYGVHPMALACLLRLSSEVGSDARSTFTFFSGDVGGAEGSYAQFIEDANLTASDGRLNLYTVDRLFTFFGKELSQRNPELRDLQRKSVNGYFASLDALRKSLQAQGMFFRAEDHKGLKILKAILIYQLCQVAPTLENIQFGLYCVSSAEKKQIESQLKDLVKNGAVFFRQQSKTYELAVGTGEDPYDLVERYVSDPSLHPQNMVTAFLETAGAKQNLDFMESKNYNLPFGEDKRFRLRFVWAKDLGEALWDEIRSDWEQARSKPNTGYEGTLVYALCEDEAEVNTARDAVASILDHNVAVAVPHSGQPFTELLLKVKACQHYLPPNQAQTIGAQTESRLRDLLENPADGYLTQLQRTLSAILEGDGACWYGQDGKVLVDKPKQAHKPADMLCEALFAKRCRIKHTDLNLCHDEKWRTGKNTALKQAVDMLLKGDQVLIDNGNPDNHGEKRYLEKVLLKGAGALRKTGSQGTVTTFFCEKDPGKISDDFPVLKELCERLAKLNPGDSFAAGKFIGDVTGEPWGVGGTPLMLALAHVIRAYGERLIVYKDSTKTVEQPMTSYEDLNKLVSDPGCKVVFEVRSISAAQTNLIELIAKGVDAPPLKHGETRALSAAFEAVFSWWDKLPEVSKVIALYEKDRQPRLTKLKNLLSGVGKAADRFDLILQQLPALYSDSLIGKTLTETEAETLGAAFSEDVKLLNSAEQIVQRRLAEAVCEIYGAKGDMIECEKVVNQWYSNLTPVQRDPSRYEDEASQLLNRLGNPSVPFGTKMMKLLPKDYGFGEVADWSALPIDVFVAKLKQAKDEIEKAKPLIEKPEVEEKVHVLRENQELLVKVPKGAAKIIYTIDGSDPKQSEHTETCDNELDLVELLKGRPKLQVKIRAVDRDGNASGLVNIELVNKDREYELQVKKNMFGDTEATFRCPNDKDGLLAVLKSVVNYGVKKKLISGDSAENLRVTLEKLIKDE